MQKLGLLAVGLLGLLLSCWYPQMEGSKGSTAFPSPGPRVAAAEQAAADARMHDAGFEEPGAVQRPSGATQKTHQFSVSRAVHPSDKNHSIARSASKGPRGARRGWKVALLTCFLTAVLVRALYVALSSRKAKENYALSKRLQVWGDMIDIEKKKLTDLRETLAEMRRANDQNEGILQSKRQYIEQQEMMLRAEEEELKEKEARLEAIKKATEEVEKQVAITQSAFVGRGGKDEVSENRRARGFRTVGQAAQLMQQVEKEFDSVVSAGPASRSWNPFSVDHLDLTTIRGAMSVLKSLPHQPSTSDQAKDILKARRLLLGAAVRCQAATWTAIRQLLTIKAEWLDEVILEKSGRGGLDSISAMVQEEWRVQEQQQARAKLYLEELDEQVKVCVAKQQQLHERAASDNLSKEEAEELEGALFHWENYEVSVRAQRALVLSTEAAAFTTREEFFEQRKLRVQRAFDNQAERRRRLPSDNIRLAELETALSAISEELKELKEFFDGAKNLREEYDVENPENAPPLSIGREQHEANNVNAFAFEEKRRSSMYSRPLTTILVKREHEAAEHDPRLPRPVRPAPSPPSGAKQGAAQCCLLARPRALEQTAMYRELDAGLPFVPLCSVQG